MKALSTSDQTVCALPSADSPPPASSRQPFPFPPPSLPPDLALLYITTLYRTRHTTMITTPSQLPSASPRYENLSSRHSRSLPPLAISCSSAAPSAGPPAPNIRPSTPLLVLSLAALETYLGMPRLRGVVVWGATISAKL